jgi:catechol 2,3-dioxygenase-like lactoylglutathione lyase family enzyme
MPETFRASSDVVIRAEDWPAAIRFYSTVLGLPQLHQADGFAGFDTGAFRLYVEAGPAHGPVFEFLAPDFETAKQRLLAAGCVIQEENPNVPNCYLRDPYGLVFNLAPAPSLPSGQP